MRARIRGDCFQPHGAGGTQKISDFMINEKIPAAWRDQIPLLMVSDDVAWVCGWRVDERFIVTPKAKEVWLAIFVKAQE
jgi:tRNA(Ile)-lysidine synthase